MQLSGPSAPNHGGTILPQESNFIFTSEKKHLASGGIPSVLLEEDNLLDTAVVIYL